jgi:hypothetical protein
LFNRDSLVEIIGIHFHIDGGKLVVALGSTKAQIAPIRIGLGLLGIPIMLYGLPPQNNLFLFIIGLGFWEIMVLFGNLQNSTKRKSTS